MQKQQNKGLQIPIAHYTFLKLKKFSQSIISQAFDLVYPNKRTPYLSTKLYFLLSGINKHILNIPETIFFIK